MAGDNNVGGPCTLRSTDTELDPQLAVSVTGVVAVTTLGANVNGAELLPDGTITALGAGTTSGRELVNVTLAPPDGGEPLTSTKPAGVLPPEIATGLTEDATCRRRSDGGSIVSGTDFDPVVGRVAVIVTGVDVVTCLGSIGNDAKIPVASSPPSGRGR